MFEDSTMKMHHETSNRVRKLVTRSITALMLLAATQQASANVTYSARYNSGGTPQTFFYETPQFADPNYPSGHQIQAYANPLGVGSLLTVKGTNIDNVFSSILVDDVIFTSTDPNKISTTVTFSALFSGSASSTNSGGAAHAYGTLHLNGAVSPSAFFMFPDSSGIFTTVSVTTTVPVGSPVTIYALLDLAAGAPSYHTTSIDFMHSLSFDAASVFDLEAGVTANSASWGLVDNRLSTVPLPAGAWLFGSGMFGLIAVAKRNRRQRQGVNKLDLHPSCCSRLIFSRQDVISYVDTSI
jgi:hypothetical protein